MPPKKGKSKAAAATEVVRSSRFKTLEVDERISIKSFVEKHKLKFATGKGFYQLTKPETIQFHKEIVVRRKSDGKMASGDEVKNCFFLKWHGRRFLIQRKDGGIRQYCICSETNTSHTTILDR